MKRALKWIARSFVALFVLLVGLGSAGAAYEAVASAGDAERYPAPGSLVDVGGHFLHIHCVGAGAPTVVIETGFADLSLSWRQVQAEVAPTTRVCAYDRAGYAWSEPGPMPRTPEVLAAELRTLLKNAGEPGPYVLVGHSTGGPRVRAFAAAYPGDVAGLVLVDARHEDFDAYVGADAMRDAVSMTETMYGAFGLVRRVGVWRVFGPGMVRSIVGDLDPETVNAYVAMTMTPTHLAAALDELRTQIERPARTSHLGRTPLVVIAHGKPLPDAAQEAAWQAAQVAMAKLSTHGRLVVADGVGHAVQTEAPRLVAAEIASLVAEVRAGGIR